MPKRLAECLERVVSHPVAVEHDRLPGKASDRDAVGPEHRMSQHRVVTVGKLPIEHLSRMHDAGI